MGFWRPKGGASRSTLARLIKRGLSFGHGIQRWDFGGPEVGRRRDPGLELHLGSVYDPVGVFSFFERLACLRVLDRTELVVEH